VLISETFMRARAILIVGLPLITLGVPLAAAPPPAAPCSSAYGTALGEMREAQADHKRAEIEGAKAQSCARAKLTVAALQRAIDAVKRLPRGCPPSNRTTTIQYHVREQMIWRGKISRTCSAATGARPQHKIIHIE
jgi:hypothetical protein